jgi:hypothetical protein
MLVAQSCIYQYTPCLGLDEKAAQRHHAHVLLIHFVLDRPVLFRHGPEHHPAVTQKITRFNDMKLEHIVVFLWQI